MSSETIASPEVSALWSAVCGASRIAKQTVDYSTPNRNDGAPIIMFLTQTNRAANP